MKKYIKPSFKVMIVYISAVFIFTFFIVAPLSMENNQYLWLTLLSFVVFMFLWSYMVQQIRKIGMIESRPVSEIKGYPLKGIIYGFLGFSPFILFEIIYFIVYQPEYITHRFLHGIFRCLFGPMYFIIRGLGYTWYAYVIATVIVPIMAMIGYMIGFLDVSIRNRNKKNKDEDFLND